MRPQTRAPPARRTTAQKQICNLTTPGGAQNPRGNARKRGVHQARPKHFLKARANVFPAKGDTCCNSRDQFGSLFRSACPALPPCLHALPCFAPEKALRPASVVWSRARPHPPSSHTCESLVRRQACTAKWHESFTAASLLCCRSCFSSFPARAIAPANALSRGLSRALSQHT